MIRTVFAAAIALAVVACTETPTAVDVAPLFSRSEVAGAVTIITSNDIVVVTDPIKRLRVSIGFDRDDRDRRGHLEKIPQAF